MYKKFKKRSIRINSILNIFYTLTNILFPIIIFPYISRVLSVDGMGKVSFFSVISNYITMFASLGLSTYGIRETAKMREDRVMLGKVTSELFIINMISSFGIVVILIIVYPFINKFTSEPILFAITLVTVLITPFGVDWFYSGVEQYDYILKRIVLLRILSLIMIFLLIHNKNDYIKYSIIMLVTTLCSVSLNFFHIRHFISFYKINFSSLKKHIKPMLVLFSSILAINVYTNLDTIMLGFICGDREVGLYSSAVKIKNLLLLLVNSISIVLLPRLSYYIDNNFKEEYSCLLKKSISVIMIIAVPLTLFFIIEAHDCIMFLGGENYLDAVPAMKIIMPILIVSGFSNITGNQILIPKGKDSKFMVAVIFGAVVNLIFNFLFMPILGSIGAAIGTLIAEVTQMSVQIYFSKDELRGIIDWRDIFQILISGITASIIVLSMEHIIKINYILNLVLMAIIYFGVYSIIMLIKKNEVFIDIIVGLLRNIKVRK